MNEEEVILAFLHSSVKRIPIPIPSECDDLPIFSKETISKYFHCHLKNKRSEELLRIHFSIHYGFIWESFYSMSAASKLKRLSSLTYPERGGSLRDQARMVRNLPKLVGAILEVLEDSRQKAGAHDLALRNIRHELKFLTEELNSKKEVVETRNDQLLLAQLEELEQKVDYQHSLLVYETQRHFSETGGALLRESCFSDWWNVFNARFPHEAAFQYFDLIKDLPVSLLDIGANTGISALSAHKCAPKWPIHSIEALGILEPMLKLTKRYFDKSSHPFEYMICGLGREDTGKQKMQVAIVGGQYVDTMATFTPGQFEKPYIVEYLNGMTSSPWDGRREEIETEFRRFDGLHLPLDTPHVFVKMDVEGFELEVLPGMKNFLNERKPGILIESDEPHAVSQLLGEMGYMSEWYHFSASQGCLVEGLGIQGESQGNFFFFHKDSPLFTLAKA